MKLAGNLIREGYGKFTRWREYVNSRRYAHVVRKKIAREKGYNTVDRRMIRRIKRYAEEVFGSESYWPWLAAYTELRGEFFEGWIPDDYYKLELMPALNPRPVANLSKIKSYDHRLFPDFAVEPLAVHISGGFYDHEQNPLCDADFLKRMKHYGAEVVIKEDETASGQGITFKNWTDVSRNDFMSGNNYVVQPSVKQHEVLADLYNRAINTVRVATYLSPEGKVSVHHLSLRTGFDGARVVNVSRGGVELLLNIEGSVVSNALDSMGLEIGSRHPDTGFLYEKLKVPSIPEAIRRCIESHYLFPYVRFIAWDLYIDENEIPRLIEWNAWMPDIWVNEALIGPLWRDQSI
jgi:hypothetical protein